MSLSRNTTVSKAVSYALSHGYQIAPDALKLLEEFADEGLKKKEEQRTVDSIISLIIEEKVRLSISEVGSAARNRIEANDLFAIEPELFEGLGHKGVSDVTVVQPGTPVVNDIEARVEVIRDPSDKVRPVGIEGFGQLFQNRYEKLMKILRERPEARQLSKVAQLNVEKGGRIAGLVYSKRPTKNGIELTIDDDSGKVSAVAFSEQMRKTVNEVALDQCVMVEVESRGGRLYVKSITQPDLPSRVVSPSKKTVYAVFLSDLHIGSNKFLEGPFGRFLDWLSGKGLRANDDGDILRRLKYVIIAGDIVDGVGVFPNQEYELVETNVYKQYDMVWSKLRLIAEHLSVLGIPGNHDCTRQALPQPMIPRSYAESLYNLKNLTMLGNPALIKLHGVSVLVYHGRSLDDVLATTPGLSYERPAAAMKVLLKARHLAPIFALRTPIAPDTEDHLVIEEVPDIFHAGHIHTVGVENYKGTLIINSGTWQAQTGYQANLGIMPRPGLVPIVNLATMEVFTREFLTTYEPSGELVNETSGA